MVSSTLCVVAELEGTGEKIKASTLTTENALVAELSCDICSLSGNIFREQSVRSHCERTRFISLSDDALTLLLTYRSTGSSRANTNSLKRGRRLFAASGRNRIRVTAKQRIRCAKLWSNPELKQRHQTATEATALLWAKSKMQRR